METEENKDPEFEPIPPQEKWVISALQQINENGFRNILDAHWKESLINPTVCSLTLEEVVERYSDVLEPKQLQYFKDLIENGKVRKTSI